MSTMPTALQRIVLDKIAEKGWHVPELLHEGNEPVAFSHKVQTGLVLMTDSEISAVRSFFNSNGIVAEVLPLESVKTIPVEGPSVTDHFFDKDPVKQVKIWLSAEDFIRMETEFPNEPWFHLGPKDIGKGDSRHA